VFICEMSQLTGVLAVKRVWNWDRWNTINNYTFLEYVSDLTLKPYIYIVMVSVKALLEKFIGTPARICLDYSPYMEAGEVAAAARRFMFVISDKSYLDCNWNLCWYGVYAVCILLPMLSCCREHKMSMSLNEQYYCLACLPIDCTTF
jgi:hypothetical protein